MNVIHGYAIKINMYVMIYLNGNVYKILIVERYQIIKSVAVENVLYHFLMVVNNQLKYNKNIKKWKSEKQKNKYINLKIMSYNIFIWSRISLKWFIHITIRINVKIIVART